MARIMWITIGISVAAGLSGCDAASLSSASGEYVVVGPAPAHGSSPSGGKY